MDECRAVVGTGRSAKGYWRMLEKRDVRLWYENVARGSKVTADVYLRRLGNFCEAHHILGCETWNFFWCGSTRVEE